VKSDKNPIPYCLYTSPEVASIGLTQEEAEKRGNQVVLGYFPFAAGARPAIFGIKEGIIKIVAEKKYGEILGVHIVGPYATELISLASLAIKNELTLKEIGQVIYAHPSFAENFQAAINDTINTMKKY
jgi:dihydrolipoamide dehydrogenase